MKTKILIVEDEYAAVNNLVSIINEIDSNIEILEIIGSIKDLKDWLKKNNPPDLGFFDIQLSDGNIFEIFQNVSIDFPIIFTTAYSEYAINAFKVNGIDYILKPINIESVKFSLSKYQSLGKFNAKITEKNLYDVILELNQNNKTDYKQSFLIHYKDRLIPVATDTFAYFFIENKIVYGLTFNKEKHVIEHTLEELENVLNPNNFFRVNRQFILNRKSIIEISIFFNSRYSIKVKPSSNIKIVTSKSKSTNIKNWLDN